MAQGVIKYYGDSQKFIVNITDYEGKPIANKSVYIEINGEKYITTTQADDTTKIDLILYCGVCNATVTVGNKTIKSVVIALSIVNGTDITKVYRNGAQYYGCQ